jgi:glycosyltransferase involved in cell wall biosynthesis
VGETPFFSIVMPTRNRCELLRYALQSALNQTFDDYEIVVVDNFSSDDTANVVKQVGGDRVRYVRTDKVLPMHDNWDFALSQARGEWIGFLCDDDAYYPQLVGEVAGVVRDHPVEVVCWGTSHYFLDSPSGDPARKGRVISGKCTGQIVEAESRPELESWLSMEPRPGRPGIPKMLNSCCRRSLVDRIVKSIGRFFLPSNPDYTSSVAMLAMTDKYVYISKRLAILGSGSHITGTDPVTGRATSHVEVVKDFGGKPVVLHAPLGMLLVTNSIVDSFLEVQRALPRELADYKVNWFRYFEGCYRELIFMKNREGMDMTVDLREFRQLLRKQPIRLQASVRLRMAYLWLRYAVVRGWFRRFLAESGAILRLGRLHTIKSSQIGSPAGYRNILEAVRDLSSQAQPTLS